MKLNALQIEKLSTAHNALNWYVRKAVIDGREQDVKQPYVFSAKGTLALLANRKALRKATDDLKSDRDDLIRHISGGKEKIEGPEQMEKFVAALMEAAKIEHEVELRKLTIEDLNLGPTNPITPETLDALELVLEG